MSHPDQVAIICDGIESLSPNSGGRYGCQLRVGLSMSDEQKRMAIMHLLGGMPEPDAYAMVVSEFPEWFKVAP